MAEFACPECGQQVDPTCHVAVGDSGGYRPVFGRPVVVDIGRCDNCNINLERMDGGAWRRQGSQ